MYTESNESGLSKLKALFRKKWFLAGGMLFVVILVGLVFLSGRKAPNSGNQDTSEKEILMTKAIAKQQKADEGYALLGEKVTASYPWIHSLPVWTEQYFVYFNIKKESFVGRLYPTKEDNVEEMKVAIIQELRLSKKVPATDYPFEWTVMQK